MAKCECVHKNTSYSPIGITFIFMYSVLSSYLSPESDLTVLSPLSSPSHLAMALLLEQQLALVNLTDCNIRQLTERNQRLESCTSDSSVNNH